MRLQQEPSNIKNKVQSSKQEPLEVSPKQDRLTEVPQSLEIMDLEVHMHL